MALSQSAGPVVRTQRLLLRPLQQSDAPGVHRIRSSPEVMKWTPSLPETDVSQSEEWVAGCLSRPNCYNFVVEELDIPNPQIIGLVGAIRTPEVGYLFHADSWGKGYATEALAAFMPLLWEHVDPESAPEDRRYDYAFAMLDPEHVGSRRVLEKCGFTFAALTPQDFKSPTLGIRDTAKYQIVRPITNKRATNIAINQ